METLRKLLNTCSRVFPKVLGIYVCVFVLYYVIAGQVTAITLLEESIPFDSVFYRVIFHGGAILAIIGFACGELTHRTPGLRWFIVFTVIVLISAVVNYDKALVTNILNALYMFSFLCIFSYYGFWVYSTSEGKSHLKKLLLVSFIIFTVFCLISLLQLLFMHSYAIVLDTGETKRQGFTDGRLFGILNHPNADATLSVLAMTFGVYYLAHEKPRHAKLIIVGIAINYLYFVATGSRSARICLAVVFVVCWFLASKKSGLFDGEAPAWFTRKNIFIAGVVSVGMCFVLDYAIAGYVSLAKPLLDDLGLSHNAYNILASRPDTQLSNISNNRFDIWLSYIGILSDGSFLFGWGFYNLVSEIAAAYPFAYASQAFYMPHNSLLMICAVSGIFAMLVWVGLIIAVVVCFVRFVRGAFCGDVQLGDVLTFSVFAIILAESSFANTIWYWANWDLPFFIVAMAYIFARFCRKRK